MGVVTQGKPFYVCNIMYAEITLPPGVYRSGTDRQSRGRWFDSNLVRWYSGALQPIGGWRQFGSSTMSGRPSAMAIWKDNSDSTQIVVGTHTHLYHSDLGGNLNDISPSDLAAGYATGSSLVGYGTGAYNGNWGYGLASTQSGSTGILDATTWSMDLFGEKLIACSDRDGRLLQWGVNTGVDAAAIVADSGSQGGTVPTSNQAVVVTAERFVFALGAGGNPRKVQWSDQEQYTYWAPLSTNQAGDFELVTGGRIMTGFRVKEGTMILTTTDAHLASYIGPPFVFSFQEVGRNCGVIGPRAWVVGDSVAAWMGTENFFVFDGYVKPLNCDVNDYVFSDINTQQRAKIWGMSIAAYGEFWWFYPSSGSNDNDRYVMWNSRENTWAVGAIDRSAGLDSNITFYPLMAQYDSTANTAKLYEHEVGYGYSDIGGSSTEATPYVESGPIEMSPGDRYVHVRKLIPDEKNLGDTRIKFFAKPYPNSTETTHGPFTLTEPTSVRFGGREFKMRIEGVQDAFRIGDFRLDMHPGARR